MKMGVEEAISVEAPMKMEGKERVFVVFGDEDEVWESEEPKPESPSKRMEMEVGKKVDVWKDARTRGTGAGGDGAGRRTTLDDCEPVSHSLG
jgi:hypothetical protein